MRALYVVRLRSRRPWLSLQRAARAIILTPVAMPPMNPTIQFIIGITSRSGSRRPWALDDAPLRVGGGPSRAAETSPLPFLIADEDTPVVCFTAPAFDAPLPLRGGCSKADGVPVQLDLVGAAGREP
jgi:hypothetical protein